jgi:hypothetical protein
LSWFRIAALRLTQAQSAVAHGAARAAKLARKEQRTLFLLDFSAFSGFSSRLSALGGKLDDAKVETSHPPSTPNEASNRRRRRAVETPLRADIKCKTERRRHKGEERLSRHDNSSTSASPPVKTIQTMVRENGERDGTRTRDLRRDRPAL